MYVKCFFVILRREASMTEEYKLRIADSFTPATLPMGRLSDYIAQLAVLLGESAYVHFKGIEEGSAVLVAAIDQPAAQKVRERFLQVRNGDGPIEARKAFENIDRLLKEDNATGTLTSVEDSNVIRFPGKDRLELIAFGPFRQDGTLDGQLLRVGGRDETVPVHLRYGNVVYTGLHCSPDLAREIAPHLLGPVLRVHGTGKWFRTGTGIWELKSFRISAFEVLEDTPLLDVVGTLQKTSKSEWNQLIDPVQALLASRNCDGEVN
jgi:hypothetical protein